MRINVGCGQTPTPGWRNFDNSPSLLAAKIPFLARLLNAVGLVSPQQFEYMCFARNHRVEYADASNLPIEDRAADALYSSHMLEHLRYDDEVTDFLSEARRVLCPGGVLRLAVPDLQGLAESYLSGGDTDRFIERTGLVCDCATDLTTRLRLLFAGHRNHHLWMYDGDSLCELLRDHGFEEPAVLDAGSTRIRSPGSLDLYERSEGSVYVEAVRPR